MKRKKSWYNRAKKQNKRIKKKIECFFRSVFVYCFIYFVDFCELLIYIIIRENVGSYVGRCKNIDAKIRHARLFSIHSDAGGLCFDRRLFWFLWKETSEKMRWRVRLFGWGSTNESHSNYDVVDCEVCVNIVVFLLSASNRRQKRYLKLKYIIQCSMQRFSNFVTAHCTGKFVKIQTFYEKLTEILRKLYEFMFFT